MKSQCKMKKQKLEVKAALKLYNPVYPSYEDKNPLLYPETRPYPFTHRFMDWAAKGGLAGILMISGNTLAAQSKQDLLYNPFPLENAGVPYTPVMFGTGMPDRLSSDEAKKVIVKAFRESGIILEENTYLESDPEIPITGYSHKDEIGYVFIDHSNMDNTFRKYSDYRRKHLAKRSKLDFKKDKEEFNTRAKNSYERYKEDKLKYIKENTHGVFSNHQQIFLKELQKQNISQNRFNEIFLQYKIGNLKDGSKLKHQKLIEFQDELRKRFGNTLTFLVVRKKLFLLKRPIEISEEYQHKIEMELQTIMELKSDKNFMSRLKSLISFTNLDFGMHPLLGDEEFLKIRYEIMCNYPANKWFDHTDRLESCFDQKYLSLDEAKKIDKNNKKGRQFIAPISRQDPMMIVPNSYEIISDDLRNEELELLKEMNDKNGMTEEVLDQRKQEMKKLNLEYRNSNFTHLSKEEKALKKDEWRQKINAVKTKYKDMELLSEAEKEVYKRQFDEMRSRMREWQRENHELVKMKTLRKLESEVKTYIEWARSQMGN